MTVAGENASKNMLFWVFFSVFQSDLYPKGSNVIFVVSMGYYQVPPTVGSNFKEVLSTFRQILGHFRVKIAKNG